MGVSLIPALARRFLVSKHSDRFLSLISWVSIVGVALGVLALVVVTSVINGFESELAKLITGMNGDVILYTRGNPIEKRELVEDKIRSTLPQVVAVTPSFTTELMASGPNGVAGAVFEGIDRETVGSVTEIPRRLEQGRLPEADNEVVLGSAIAEKIGAKVGGEVRLVAPFFGGEHGETGSPKALKAQVVGIVKMGMYEYDSKYVFATLPSVQAFFNLPGRVTAFRIKLLPGTDSRMAAEKLGQVFVSPFRAKDWGQMNKNLLIAISLEKKVIAIILTVIVIVAAFNVVSTLMMMIHDKSREISILQAMGFRRMQSFGLFCFIGMGIGSVGTALGIILGLGIDWVLGETRLIRLPADIYPVSYLPVVFRWQEIAMIGGMALLITFGATLYPSRKVSIRPPLEGLRYE